MLLHIRLSLYKNEFDVLNELLPLFDDVYAKKLTNKRKEFTLFNLLEFFYKGTSSKSTHFVLKNAHYVIRGQKNCSIQFKINSDCKKFGDFGDYLYLNGNLFETKSAKEFRVKRVNFTKKPNYRKNLKNQITIYRIDFEPVIETITGEVFYYQLINKSKEVLKLVNPCSKIIHVFVSDLLSNSLDSLKSINLKQKEVATLYLLKLRSFNVLLKLVFEELVMQRRHSIASYLFNDFDGIIDSLKLKGSDNPNKLLDRIRVLYFSLNHIYHLTDSINETPDSYSYECFKFLRDQEDDEFGRVACSYLELISEVKFDYASWERISKRFTTSLLD